MIRKIVLILIASIGVVVVAFAIFVTARQHLRFDAPYPDVAASADTAVIARGRYVVHNLVSCSGCHGDTTQMLEASEGKDIPLSGGRRWDIPPGTFYARNITPDSASGVGKISDGAIVRALRYGVGHDGRALLPFMEVQGLSDEDLRAVVSYLRAQAPVRNVVPPHHYTLLGRIVRATVLARPVGPRETPPKITPRGATVENGRYLVESVTLCWACHTQRNMATGALVGPRFGGATGFDSNVGRTLVVAAQYHERSRDRSTRDDERRCVRGPVPIGAGDPRIADALARLPEVERRRPARDLPLPQDRSGGASGRGVTRGGGGNNSMTSPR